VIQAIEARVPPDAGLAGSERLWPGLRAHRFDSILSLLVKAAGSPTRWPEAVEHAGVDYFVLEDNAWEYISDQPPALRSEVLTYLERCTKIEHEFVSRSYGLVRLYRVKCREAAR
jgi:hypothetical protein